MAESVDPGDLERAYGEELAGLAGEFELLGLPITDGTLARLSVEEVAEYDEARAERQLTGARERFESAASHALSKEKLDQYRWTSHGPYNAIGDDGQIYAVRLLHSGNGEVGSPYNLYKVFTTRVYVDEAAGTSTEHYRELWYVSGSTYKHIPNGLRHKGEYMIVRPIEGGEGIITHIEDNTEELTQLNRLTHLVQQSPAFHRRQQRFGHTILWHVRRGRPQRD